MNSKVRASVFRARMMATTLVVAVSTLGVAVIASGDAAKDAGEAELLVEKAKLTVDSFASDSKIGKPVRDLVKKAKGVYVAPEVLRGAFIVGASGGSGVLLIRGDDSGTGRRFTRSARRASGSRQAPTSPRSCCSS